MPTSKDVLSKVNQISQAVHEQLAQKDSPSFYAKIETLQKIGLDPATTIPMDVEAGMASLIELGRSDAFVAEYLMRCAENNLEGASNEMKSWIQSTHEGRDQLYDHAWKI